jgi:hypothetical protein
MWKKMGGKKGGIWCQNILIFSKKPWPNFEKVFLMHLDSNFSLVAFFKNIFY